MGNILWWQSIHALCIFAYFGMLLAGGIAFVSTSLDDVSKFGSTIVSLPWAASAVGAFGMFFNIVLFNYLLGLDRTSLHRGFVHRSTIPLDQSPLNQSTRDWNPQDETPETFYFWKKVATLFGTVFNLLFVAADISLAAKLGATSSKNSGSDSSSLLNGVCALAVISVAAAIATIAADIMKLLRDMAHQRDIDMRDIDDGDINEGDANEINVEYRDEE